MPFFDPSTEVEKIVKFLHDVVEDRDIVIAISGGIDSSLVLKLASIAFPVKKIHAFFLPEGETGEIELKDIEDLSKSVNVKIDTTRIDDVVKSYINLLDSRDPVTIGNLKARIRMTVIYFYSNFYKGVVLGTTNRSEYMTGYFTKYGDGACDIEPIIHLYKTQVRQISKYLNLPEHIISKPPSAGLWSNQTDEEELGISYSDLDRILEGLDSGFEVKEEKFPLVSNLIRKSKHKRTLPLSMRVAGE